MLVRSVTGVNPVDWLLTRWSWRSFAVGAGTVLFGGAIARPALVQVVRTGLDVKDAATLTWLEARAEATRIRSEAEALRAAERSGAPGQDYGEVLAEIKKLRSEVASLKASVEKPAKS